MQTHGVYIHILLLPSEEARLLARRHSNHMGTDSGKTQLFPFKISYVRARRLWFQRM